MKEPTIFIATLVTLGVFLFVLAPHVSEMLVRARARRLPTQLALRMEEEWRGELNAIASRPGKLAFAIALMLTRRRAFVAPGEDSMIEVHDRPVGGFAMFGGWKSLVILPTLVFGIAAGAASGFMPRRYASEALILVLPADVSKEYVQGLNEEPIEERFETLSQTVTSRNNLVAILNEFEGKLGKEWRSQSMDSRIEKLRDDITVRLDKSGHSISVRYEASEPELAQAVARKLTNILIEQDLDHRQSRFNVTHEFLETELKKLAQRLTEQGDKLAREQAANGPGASRMLALDYELLQSTYRTLFARVEESRMALSLENNGGGSGFRVVDPANLPIDPFSPNRWAITGLGASAGFAFGVMAVAGLYRKQRRVLA